MYVPQLVSSVSFVVASGLSVAVRFSLPAPKIANAWLSFPLFTTTSVTGPAVNVFGETTTLPSVSVT